MGGQPLYEFSFESNESDVNLSTKIVIKENGKDISIHHMLLFQRLLAIISYDNTIELEDVFSFEMSHTQLRYLSHW